MRFRVTTLGKSEALRQLAEQHVNDLWIPAHLDDGQAEQFAIEHLRKWIAAELGSLCTGRLSVDALDACRWKFRDG